MHWVYKPEEAKIVTDAEYQDHLKDGWCDTPANFPVKKEVKKDEGLAKAEAEKAKEPAAYKKVPSKP